MMQLRVLPLGAMAGLLLLAGCKPKDLQAPALGGGLKRDPAYTSLKPEPTTDVNDPRRLLFAQIVEERDEEARFEESGILEGLPFKWFLRSLVNVSHDDIRKQTDASLTIDSLLSEPGLYRGRVITIQRGVIIEVSKAQIPPEYGLPPGYTVLPAIFVDTARDLWALRILCPPKSDTFERLDAGIRNDQLPVIRISGYFFKNYARKTNEANEPPWRRPLLICPEPEFSQGVPPRKVYQELEESKALRYLPSGRVEATGAEERLVVELAAGGRTLVDGRLVKGDLQEAVTAGVERFKQRLPQEQRENPGAVVFIALGGNRDIKEKVLNALRNAGVKRLAMKSEK